MSVPARATPPLPVPPRPPAALRGFEDVTRYWDGGACSWIAQVLPGHYYVTAADELISTVLGSCVSTCMRDPKTGVGGMNHFLLPDDPDQDPSGALMRYGSFAVERLINDLVKYGARRERLEVKVFGGGNVIDCRARVGAANVAFVRRYLESEGLAIASEDVGGTVARRLLYHSLTGRARVKHLETAATRKVAAKERALRVDLRRAPPPDGDVELF